MPNTNYRIVLRGADSQYDEGEADATIYPGTLIQLAADGKYDPLVSTAAEALKGAAGLKIAVEDALQGKTITDAYADGDRVFFYQPKNGDHLNILVSSGQTVVIGSKLIPTIATGEFVVAAGSETRYMFEALEASGGALGADTHIKCKCVW